MTQLSRHSSVRFDSARSPTSILRDLIRSDPKQLYGGEILLEALILPNLSETTRVTVFIVDSVDPVDNRLATVTVSDGEGTVYELTRSPNGTDSEGRTHDFVYSYVGDGLPPPGRRWTTTIDPPIDAYTEIMKGGTYSPTSIDLVSPPYDGDAITVDRSHAMTVTWNQTDPEASAVGTDHFNVLAIYSIPAGPPEDLHWICETKKNGEMTIPADVMATFPDDGLFVIGNMAHAQPKGTNGRTLHQIGRYSRVQLFTAQN